MWEVGTEISRRPVEWYSVEGEWDVVLISKYVLVSLFLCFDRFGYESGTG